MKCVCVCAKQVMQIPMASWSVTTVSNLTATDKFRHYNFEVISMEVSYFRLKSSPVAYIQLDSITNYIIAQTKCHSVPQSIMFFAEKS